MKLPAGQYPVTIVVRKASSYLPEAQEFYRLCDRKLEINPNDELVLTFMNERLVGAVRLCLEYEVFVLRSMQVHSDFQGKGEVNSDDLDIH